MHFPRSSQFWVANHDILGLVEIDREFHRNFFWDITSSRCGPHSTLSVLHFAVPSTMRSPLLDDVVRDWENIQSPFVKVLAGFAFNQDGSLLDSNTESILSIALLELFRITRITLHCPFHESLLLILYWMGCKRYFAANRLQVLLDADDSRSSCTCSWTHLSQVHVTIQTLWSQFLFPRVVWTNRLVAHSQVSPCFIIGI